MKQNSAYRMNLDSATKNWLSYLQSLVRWKPSARSCFTRLLALVTMLWHDIVYVLLLLFSIAIGPVYRTIKTPNAKQWIATLFGFGLVLCVSGISVLHPIITVIINAVIITNLSWKYEYIFNLWSSRNLYSMKFRIRFLLK